jgi:histone-lysine N-methyltransferase SETD2
VFAHLCGYQLTQVIAEKEKKSSSYREGKLEVLSDEKIIKIKKFSKDYISKILRKMEKSGKRPKPPFSTTLPTPSTSTHTPDSNDGEDTSMVSMSVEEAMDMDCDSSSDAEDDEMPDGEKFAGMSNDMPPPNHSPWTAHDANTMDLDGSFHPRLVTIPSDPRRRAPPDT